MPLAGCLLPHKLSVISIPPCLLRPCVEDEAVELGYTVIFKAFKPGSRKLQEQQVGPSFACGT
jgi:hypothetical protein